MKLLLILRLLCKGSKWKSERRRRRMVRRDFVKLVVFCVADVDVCGTDWRLPEWVGGICRAPTSITSMYSSPSSTAGNLIFSLQKEFHVTLWFQLQFFRFCSIQLTTTTWRMRVIWSTYVTTIVKKKFILHSQFKNWVQRVDSVSAWGHEKWYKISATMLWGKRLLWRWRHTWKDNNQLAERGKN